MTARNETPHRRRSLLLTSLVLAATVVLALACGGGFKTGAAWDPKEGRLFDDGVDILGDLSKLSGKWEYDARDELDARANLADTVAVVDVLAVQVNKDLDGVESRKLDARIERILYGESPSVELALLCTQESLGWELLLRHETRIVGRHIVFLRWFEGADGKPANHFHLSPSSPELEAVVSRLVEKRKAEEEAASKAR